MWGVSDPRNVTSAFIDQHALLFKIKYSQRHTCNRASLSRRLFF